MNFQYKFKLPIPVEQAWPALMDIKRITPCLPGASIESGDGNEFNGGIKVKLGPITMNFRGAIHITSRDDVAKVAIIDASAKETKGAGAAKATVTLQAVSLGAESEITVISDFTVSGKPAQFGRGVMEEVGEKLMSEFANRLSKEVGTQNPPEAAAQEMAGNPDSAGTQSEIIGHSSPDTANSSGNQHNENEALDLLSAAWKPVVKRLLVAAGVVGVGAAVYFLAVSH